ncbi:MAG TPA: transcription elongation factor GreA [Candidatus Vogelbacteria bacterium]|uniref:Transcription elongation factor GreA n=1 Tax=Candidatus Vogelbacteria bacterium RIFOXYD1_FULL_51_18 TaxID=1802440 RepID=A0A1G2QLK6_9BACT|nr:MAG: Transcription elongation factor GreA [Parcubacteria group bacterium GW2011_GWC1_51_35]KKW24930.1 MAG: Transcription elongation factor GreA [Parcubacteria group bacterium GW2011_GWF2_52_12]KKW34734.1 MAG: Transcription elongation factor GreA [Parcubacteria group bacterium GW2011_GWB1_53_43]OHA60882.1 MAG: hypothetical protein A2569_02810 [Candidatus Vogelbacteria bacterium RIFOXYD1_FULL_51_18]HBB65396.1 transcription elongation factor GreA [Candidatus Vogelbacteria bacterium]
MSTAQGEYISEKKLKELQGELQELKTVTRKRIAEQLEYAKSLGDLSENAEYHEAREEQSNVEERISRIEDILRRAVIVGTHRGGTVDLGATVIIEKKNGGRQTVTIVGSEEVNSVQGKISNESPLGSVLIGKKKGDAIIVPTPRGSTEYTIITVQ